MVSVVVRRSRRPPAQAESKSETPIAQKVCPVLGNPINPDIHVDYKGRRVYFCCPMCVPTFEKDPEKYLKKLDEQEKAAEPAAPAAAGQGGESGSVCPWRRRRWARPGRERQGEE